jgi:fatty acid-binding protein DegV
MSATAICTDSNAQLPAALAARLNVTVVPLTIALGDRAFDEPELDVDEFYGLLRSGQKVTTSQPSPGRFAQAYVDAAERGAHELLSIHIGSAFSGTVRSAELAAEEAGVPVKVVDTGTASFGVGICVLTAADVLAEDGSASDAAEAIDLLVPKIGSVFMAAPPGGGRIPAADRLQVFSLAGAAAEPLAPAGTVEQAARTMAAQIRAQPAPLRVAVGHADASVAGAADQLAATLEASENVSDALRYRVGPSVGAHTGGNSFGAFWWPGDAS